MDLEAKRRKRLASERTTFSMPVRKPGPRVALVYPNTYSVGMSNLGFQALYHLLSGRDDIACERIFLRDREEREKAGTPGKPYRSLETGSLLSAFDLLAFSVSFELDYLHILEILKASDIRLLRQNRQPGRDPMVWIGGIGVSLNPEPLANFADLIFVGEGEEGLPELIDAFTESPVRDSEGFNRFCRKVRRREGVYFPHAYTFSYDAAGRVTKIDPDRGFPERVRRRWVADLDRFQTVSRVLTPDTEFDDMYLVELDRGCGRHCRFCAAGYITRPPRFRPLEGILGAVREGLTYTDRIGLVGAAASDYPWMAELAREIRTLGGRLSVSSLRADSVNADLIRALAESGHKTVTLAPEGGSQRLREIINKGFGEEEILRACRLAFASGILNLKLYFMVGLPGEEEEDLKALVDLVLKIRGIQLEESKPIGRIGRITVSLNCFVPKPQTPYQWSPMNKKSALSKKIGYIEKRLRPEGNVKVIHDLPKWALIQGLLARSDRRISGLLLSVVDHNGNWAQALKEAGADWLESVHRSRGKEEIFPWDVVESGCSREYLFQEYERSLSGRFSPACPEDLKCGRCGVCGESDNSGD